MKKVLLILCIMVLACLSVFANDLPLLGIEIGDTKEEVEEIFDLTDIDGIYYGKVKSDYYLNSTPDYVKGSRRFVSNLYLDYFDYLFVFNGDILYSIHLIQSGDKDDVAPRFYTTMFIFNCLFGRPIYLEENNLQFYEYSYAFEGDKYTYLVSFEDANVPEYANDRIFSIAIFKN